MEGFFDANPVKTSWLLGEDYPNLGLTARQQQCLFYLAHGKKNKEIAKLLNLSSRTVETHIERIRHALNCATRTSVVEKAHDEGFAYFVPMSLFKQ